MDADEAEQLCDELTELASTGPSKDPATLVKANAILRKITQSSLATSYVRERATEVDRALSNWFDSEERFHALLKNYRRDIYALIDRLHGALREAGRFRSPERR
jgi:phosphoribosylaminoimidazole-succinocarboxamide synthase